MSPLTAHRTSVQYWHSVHNEPCDHGPGDHGPDGFMDATCAEHGRLWVRAGDNGWPADLADLGGLRMSVHTEGQWIDVAKVLDWRPITAERGAVGALAQYTVVLAGADEPATITPDRVRLLHST